MLLLLVFLSLDRVRVRYPATCRSSPPPSRPALAGRVLFATYSAGQFLGELFWGRLSDRIGRGPVLLITIIGSAWLLWRWPARAGIWIAVLVRGAAGFFSGNMSAIQGYIVDVSPPEKLAGRLGLIGSAFGVGFVVGPALGRAPGAARAGRRRPRPPLLRAPPASACWRPSASWSS